MEVVHQDMSEKAKIRADILIEFLEVALHTLLFARRLYPAGK
jgi:hypothetical protein